MIQVIYKYTLIMMYFPSPPCGTGQPASAALRFSIRVCVCVCVSGPDEEGEPPPPAWNRTGFPFLLPLEPCVLSCEGIGMIE